MSSFLQYYPFSAGRNSSVKIVVRDIRASGPIEVTGSHFCVNELSSMNWDVVPIILIKATFIIQQERAFLAYSFS